MAAICGGGGGGGVCVQDVQDVKMFLLGHWYCR